MKLVWKIMLFAVVAVCCYVLVLYAIQDELITRPQRFYINPQAAGVPQFEEVYVAADDGTELRLWYAKGDKAKPAVLFLHGNAFQNAFFAPQLQPLMDKGYAVLMMEYRGFGGAQGRLRQKTVFADAARAYDWLKTENYPQIVVYGYSLGCAVAVGMAELRQPDKMVLMAPFASLWSLVKEKPVPFAGLVLRDRYPSDELIKNYKNPLLIIHGVKDRLIPVHHGERLYELSVAENKTLVKLPNETHRTVFFERRSVPLLEKWIGK